MSWVQEDSQEMVDKDIDIRFKEIKTDIERALVKTVESSSQPELRVESLVLQGWGPTCSPCEKWGKRLVGYSREWGLHEDHE